MSRGHRTNRKPVAKPSTPPTPTREDNRPSSFFSTILQGFGFGIGSSVARQTVDSLMNSSISTPPKIPSSETNMKVTETETKVPKECEPFLENFKYCTQHASNEHCMHFYNDLYQCQRNVKEE